MKLSADMRYPHPVLSEYTDDYVSSEFKCGIEQHATKAGELRIVAHLEISNSTIKTLIASQRAAVGYFVICRPTFYNVLKQVPLGESERFLDLSQLFGLVQVRPVVWTLGKIEGFSDPMFNREFGAPLTVPKGVVIALGPEFRFSVDRQKFKPFDTIFELARSDTTPAGFVEVDPDEERVTLRAEDKTFTRISSMRNVSAGRTVLLNAIYLPAIMEVIAQIQNKNSGFESRKWYRVFKAKCDDLGIRLQDENSSPFGIAQRLLRRPLEKVMDVVERLQ